MEEANKLYPNSDTDIYSLWICFARILKDDIDNFRMGWNKQRSRTAWNMTPMKIYILGLQNLSDYRVKTRQNFTELN